MLRLFTIIEDRPTPPSVYNWRVYFCGITASFASVMIGYDSAFIGGTIALNSFKDEFGFNDPEKYSTAKINLISANIVSCYQAGAFFGALFAYTAGFYLGRKLGIFTFAAIFLIGAGLQLGTTVERGFGILYAGRVIGGLGIGGTSNLVPIYISELAPPGIRGRLVGLYEMGWQIGGLVGFWINYAVSKTMAPSHEQWIIPFAIQLIPAGLLLAGSLLLPESPRYLLTKDKRTKAISNLCWLRQLEEDHVYILEEVAAIDASLEAQASTIGFGLWKPLRSLFSNKSYLYRFFLGGSLFFWQNGSGINAINYYSPTVFKAIGVTGTNSSLLTTGIFGVIKTAITIVWLFFLIDRFGRRPLLLFGGGAGSICMWVVAAYIKVVDPTKHPQSSLSGGGISAIVFFYLWTASYTPTWNGTPWVLNSEMYPQTLRTLGQAWAAMNNWLWNFLVARFTPQMFTTMGYGVFMFFASLQLLSIPFVYFLIPETKGVPLESMDRLFVKDVSPRKVHPMVLEEIRLQDEEFRQNVQETGAALEKAKVQHVEGGTPEKSGGEMA